ncbi:MAG: Trm112 family protein [Thermodesulfatator sp.]|nr:MAG: Trm112 family protein [Thermodesulfatator sp.]
MGLPRELLELLVCPKCKGDLRERESPPGLICEACGLFYEIREGIPVLLVEEARPLAEVLRDESPPPSS